MVWESCLPYCMCFHGYQTGDLAGADATEEEKVLAMMSQAGEDYNPAKSVPSLLTLY